MRSHVFNSLEWGNNHKSFAGCFGKSDLINRNLMHMPKIPVRITLGWVSLCRHLVRQEQMVWLLTMYPVHNSTHISAHCTLVHGSGQSTGSYFPSFRTRKWKDQGWQTVLPDPWEGGSLLTPAIKLRQEKTFWSICNMQERMHVF